MTDNLDNSNGLANLTPWPKGKSGNPAGRPRVDKDIQNFIDQIDPKYGCSRKEVILNRIYEYIFSFRPQCLQACEMLLNRAYGKIPIAIKHVISKEEDPSERPDDGAEADPKENT